MATFEIINIDKHGYANIKKPVGCIDYHSNENEADFVGKRNKILLKIKSSHKGWANDVAREIFNNNNLEFINDIEEIK